MSALVWAAAAWAGVAVAPSDGVAITGPREPAWAILGERHAPRRDGDELRRELDRAWSERRALDNAAARARVDRVVTALRPTLDTGERDLLQRALFLRGVLDIDDAGDPESVPDGVSVGGRRVPRAWTDAIAVSPGAPAPATADAAAAVHAYDQARTALTQAGGLELDPSAPGADEVRADGLPVSQPVTLLPGRHSLSWHPVGADPVVLEIRVGAGEGGYAGEALKAWLDGLASVHGGERPLTAAEKTQLHQALGSAAVALSTDEPARFFWLVDGAARWGKPAVAAGIGVGAWGFASGDAPAVSCAGQASSPGDVLGVASVELSLTTGPLRTRVGGGAMHAFAGGFPTIAEGECALPVPSNVVLVDNLPWLWASLGRRLALPDGREIEPFLRVGGTGAHAIAQLGANVRLAGRTLLVEGRVAAGPAFNLWSDDSAHLAFVGGLETVVSYGARR